MLCGDLEGSMGDVGGNALGGDICIHMADSCCCIAGINTAL